MLSFGDELNVALSDPSNQDAADELARKTGKTIQKCLASQKQIDSIIDHIFGKTNQNVDKDEQGEHGTVFSMKGEKETADKTGTSFILKHINKVLKQGGEEILFFPTSQEINIIYINQGISQKVESIDTKMYQLVLKRLKIMTGIETEKLDNPVTSTCSLKIHYHSMLLMVTIFPFANYEAAAISLGFKSSQEINEFNLDLTPNQKMTLHKENGGLYLIASKDRKQRKLLYYNLLEEFKNLQKRVLSFENYIELELDGIMQSQLSQSSNLKKDINNWIKGYVGLYADVNGFHLPGISILELLDLVQPIISAGGQAVICTDHCTIISLWHQLQENQLNNPNNILSRVQLLLESKTMGMLCQKCRLPIDNKERDSYRQMIKSCFQIDQVEFPEDQALFLPGPGSGSCDQCNNTGYHTYIDLHHCHQITNQERVKLLKGEKVDITPSLSAKEYQLLREGEISVINYLI